MFDVIGGNIGKRSAALIRAGGTLVSVVGPSEARPNDALAIDFVVEPNRAQLSEIVQRVRDGQLRTPNGVKVSIALEELGVPYEAHRVGFESNEQFSPEFLSLNPNNKIPAILDPNGPGARPLPLFESGAILLYLADKAGRLIPQDAARRSETIQWVMFQMGGIGPMFGQLGFFHKFAGKDCEDKRPRDRYVAESKRLLAVLDKHLAGKQWMMDDEYTIADIGIFAWARNLVGNYGAREIVDFESFNELRRVLDAFAARPAVQRGVNIPQRNP